MTGKKKVGILLLLTAVLMLYGCADSSEKRDPLEDDRRTVAVSILPQQTFVEKVAGDRVDVVTMVPPGNNPENYQVKPQDMVALSNASVYFAMGVEAEKAGLLDRVADLNPEMIIVRQDEIVDQAYPHIDYDFHDIPGVREEGSDLELDHEEEDDHTHEGRDTHIWLSPKRVQVMVENIRDRLSELDPENKEFYETNAESYLQELRTLDEEIRMAMEELPYKTFLIYHPSMGYFAQDYGLTMVPIESEGKDATASRLRSIIDFAREEDVKVVFYQLEHDKNQAETIAQELGGTVMELAPLDPDYLENMRRIKDVFVQVLK
ncbi:zinc ABC transporter substrate-binding protein [Alkalibacter rhizosphaerae]|uniref:Zinc ABC transporter substrate-binding protein n=1 Tax=Alkalibacter rhizosphaerae TaxID=2815577 RepID=A0A974XGK4_9FIRM|nr:zinc ABC transporter substrate-binding protein [Alkalibacter rhizosphaerae]QSX07923.1 zinc ABC transporter substrate-binding protein [Alkalibacter rhizosphaerae]